MSLYRQKGMLMVWTHDCLAPWQTEEWKTQMRESLRATAFARMIQNQWVSPESRLITPELWDPCVVLKGKMIGVPRERSPLLFVGVDVGIKDDTAAVCAVHWFQGRLILADHQIWHPTKAEPLDLEETIEAWLRSFARHRRVGLVYADPFQFHRSATTLRKMGLRIEDFPQTVGNTVKMASVLFDVLKGKRIAFYPDPEMRQQALNTVAVESSRGFRLAKEKASAKIDVVVALSMACVAAIDSLAKYQGHSLTWPNVRETRSNEPIKVTKWDAIYRIPKRQHFNLCCHYCGAVCRSYPGYGRISLTPDASCQMVGDRRGHRWYVACKTCAGKLQEGGPATVTETVQESKSLEQVLKDGDVKIHDHGLLL